jgi:hypothetical protein
MMMAQQQPRLFEVAAQQHNPSAIDLDDDDEDDDDDHTVAQASANPDAIEVGMDDDEDEDPTPDTKRAASEVEPVVRMDAPCL